MLAGRLSKFAKTMVVRGGMGVRGSQAVADALQAIASRAPNRSARWRWAPPAVRLPSEAVPYAEHPSKSLDSSDIGERNATSSVQRR
jgi:hypothetical protein